MNHRVVVTGAGAISCFGVGAEAFWKALVQGRSGVRRIKAFETSHFRSHIAGEIPDFEPFAFIERKDAVAMDRTTHLAVVATDLALREASLKTGSDTGLVVGTSSGGISTDDAMHKIYNEKGPRFLPPLAIPMIMYSAAAGHISQRHTITGPGFTVSTSCASGSHAIGEAYRFVKHGYARAMVAGGADATLSPAIFSAWCAMRILSRRNDTPETACRPYSKDRDGLVLGEGAGFVVLEELGSALVRKAPILAEVVGYGTTHDASHITAPSARGQAAAMTAALLEAGPGTVDYISGHGTATPLNDKTETAAVRSAFGEAAGAIPMSSIKSMIGHTLGASGALAFIASCFAIRDGVIPPTINYTEPDPECDMDYVPNVSRQANLRRVMTNAFGFGGINAVLILQQYDRATTSA